MKTLLILLMLTISPVWAAAPFTAEQEARIKTLIRETLVANPEILAEAANAWQQQASNQVLKQQERNLFNDPASPRLGAKNAKLTLVVFTDYNCPYCKQFDPLLEKIVKQYPEVALVLKLVPFKGESSIGSARVALTTWQQHPEQFWPLHERLMAKKGFHDNASIAAAQQKTGVTPVAPSEQSMKTLRSNMQLAEQLGVQGTPATVIGDQILPGAVSYGDLEELVKQQLAKVKNG
ncbi:DsbA family protein [Serratia oryzae]|uniref:Copper resistance protein n=1 Tax=Serratia oryzae TaxID=2034155 RepID=A0A1S8CLE3_9GAMM|nr:DsbA family protein [Serratia oryzae]OMQ24763.1 copper resistance protein [Serratia oryzae]